MIDIEQLENLVPGYTLTDLNLNNNNNTVTVTMEFKNSRFSLLSQVKAAQQMEELSTFIPKPTPNPYE